MSYWNLGCWEGDESLPEHLSRMYPNSSALCFWGCRQVGLIFHTWWSCCNVKYFCIWVYALIYSANMVYIIKDPRIALLNEPVEGAFRKTQTNLFYVPSGQKFSKLTWILINEKLISILHYTSPWFESLEFMDTIPSISLVMATVVVFGSGARTGPGFSPLHFSFFFLLFPPLCSFSFSCWCLNRIFMCCQPPVVLLFFG